MPFRGRRATSATWAGLLLLGCGATDGGQDLAAPGSAAQSSAGYGMTETHVSQGDPSNSGAGGDVSGSGEQPGSVVAGGGTAAHEPAGETPPVASWLPHQLADFAHCGDDELLGLAAACSDSEASQALVASGTELALASPSLLELTGTGEQNRASVQFTPPASQTFGIYLGTPNVPFSISTRELQIVPSCARYLAPELSERLSGADCSQLRGVYLVSLQAGVTYTFSLGPIAPQQWVRIYVQ